MVISSIHAWETTRWKDIAWRAMDLECKKFARDIRNLDKEVRAWEAFTGLESTVLDTLTSLRAVAELQNPAIRERHWRQLMQATGVTFTMDEGTTLAPPLANCSCTFGARGPGHCGQSCERAGHGGRC